MFGVGIGNLDAGVAIGVNSGAAMYTQKKEYSNKEDKKKIS
jgi:hypothetical protein